MSMKERLAIFGLLYLVKIVKYKLILGTGGVAEKLTSLPCKSLPVNCTASQIFTVAHKLPQNQCQFYYQKLFPFKGCNEELRTKYRMRFLLSSE